MPAPSHPLLATAVQVATVAIGLAVVAVLSLSLHQAILMPSLAACLFLQVLLPDSPAAQPWAVIVGQTAGLICGILAVYLAGAGQLPVFGAGHPLEPARAAAVVLAACLTLGAQRALGAGNAAGAALAATVALGDGTPDLAGTARALAGIACIAVVGEIGRRLVLRTR